MIKRNVDMDVDASPVYGDYYYEDGGRRQNVVEVSKAYLYKPRSQILEMYEELWLFLALRRSI